jgi:hypothetical protein
VLTYFVVPVIVFEDQSLTGTFKRSGQLIRDTWGEGLGAEVGLGLITGLFTVAGLVVALALVLVLPGSVGLVAGVFVGAVAVVGGHLVGRSLTGIAKTALYQYATGTESPRYFEDVDFGRLGGEQSGRGLGGRKNRGGQI